MKSIYKKTILSAALAAAAFLSIGQAFAQQAGCDSTCGNGAGNWRAIVPLYAQERETPVVNNNSYPTTNVTQNIVQTAAPDIIPTSSAHISAMIGYIHSEGSGPWMITGGHRTCQGFGYASGYVIEYFGAGAQVACYRS